MGFVSLCDLRSEFYSLCIDSFCSILFSGNVRDFGISETSLFVCFSNNKTFLKECWRSILRWPDGVLFSEMVHRCMIM